jgi:hypothetical protein
MTHPTLDYEVYLRVTSHVCGPARHAHYELGRLNVNLLFNRASKWADVDRYIPYSGRVELRIKESVDPGCICRSG